MLRRIRGHAGIERIRALSRGIRQIDREQIEIGNFRQRATHEGMPHGMTRERGRLPELTRSRVMRFFDEYFEFPAAAEVFKDVGRGQWRPELLIADTRRLVEFILDDDRDVLKQF